jgi:hypothetical protein
MWYPRSSKPCGYREDNGGSQQKINRKETLIKPILKWALFFEFIIVRASKAKRAERSGLPRFFFGYFLCSNDKESNNNNHTIVTI